MNGVYLNALTSFLKRSVSRLLVVVLLILGFLLAFPLYPAIVAAAFVRGALRAGATTSSPHCVPTTAGTKEETKSTAEACGSGSSLQKQPAAQQGKAFDLLTDPRLPNVIPLVICQFLHPKDITALCCINTFGRRIFTSNELWKQLWDRDYGSPLLRWKVSRNVFAESLDCTDEQLEASLARHFEDYSQELRRILDFYFLFGKTYLNYILAGHNTRDECYVGLHGHIIDFTPFAPHHPGLIDSLLKECGRDATAYFEDVQHSPGARRIAEQLVVVVDRSRTRLGGCDGGGCCGLEYRPNHLSSSTTKFYGYNTRSPSGKIQLLLHNSSIPQKRMLKRIENRYERELNDVELDPTHTRGIPFYDAFQDTWKSWDADATYQHSSFTT